MLSCLSTNLSLPWVARKCGGYFVLKFLTIASFSLVLTTAELQAQAMKPVFSAPSTNIHLAQVNKGVIAKKFNHAAKAPRAQFNRAAGNAARTNAARTNAARTKAAKTTAATKSRAIGSRTTLTARMAATSARLRTTQTQRAQIPAKTGLSRKFGKAATNPTLAGRISATSARLKSRQMTAAKIPAKLPRAKVTNARIGETQKSLNDIKIKNMPKAMTKKLTAGVKQVSGLLSKTKSGSGYSKHQLNLTPPGPISRSP
jgi:hypothetical protein